MGSLPDPSESAPSFDEFSRQTSLMTSCTLLWKELSDHFSTLEQDLIQKSESLKRKLQAFNDDAKHSLSSLDTRESTLNKSMSIVLQNLEKNTKAGVQQVASKDYFDFNSEGGGSGVDLVVVLSNFCVKMAVRDFWSFIVTRKKEVDSFRDVLPKALNNCVDPPRFVLEAISEVFPVDKREDGVFKVDLGWACVVLLESLIPVMMDPVLGKERMIVTPRIKGKAEDIAETWKRSLEERGGIENVKTPDVHTFLQHLVTFGIVKKEDVKLYMELVVASAWRKQMPKLAVSLGLKDKMPDMIEELIGRGQQVDAVHFTYEVGLADKYPPVPLLRAFLKDAKKAATSLLEDPNNSGRAAHLAAKKEQSAIRAVLKCIEEYNLETEFPSDDLKKRLDQLEKVKIEKKKPAQSPATKRTRASNVGPMPPAKAGRSTNAYVSSFPSPPTYMRSPSHVQYPAPVPAYPASPVLYGSRSPSYAYSPEAPPQLVGSYAVSPVNFAPYGGYSHGMGPAYQQAYY